ncbi:hypothetical protein LZ30DRAFT_712865 [Colletotrichum cereale]|nr:hypothetical protein LZ30DRAFT_712865 [Colletotrichum cereale]
MATETFHGFPLLPGELRDLIWDHAVRPVGLRGVQHFSLFYSTEGSMPYNERLEHQLMVNSTNDQELFSGPPLPVDNTLPVSWNHNPSTYTIDAGLWTACKESYEAMCRRYKFGDWTHFYNNPAIDRTDQDYRQEDLPNVQSEEYANLPALHPVEDNSKRQYITTMPNQDLIFLKDDRPTFPVLYQETRELFSAMQYGFVNFGHFAVDCQPAWSSGEILPFVKVWNHDESDSGLKAVAPRWWEYEQLMWAGRLADWATYYMVDHRPRLKATALTEGDTKRVSDSEWEGLAVFQEIGRKYRQVPRRVADEFCDYGEEAEKEGFDTIGRFLDALDWACEEMREEFNPFRNEEASNDGWSDTGSEFQGPPRHEPYS